MKKVPTLLFLAIIIVSSFASLSQNIKVVKIGSQTWMTQNLNVERFRNGDVIPQAKTAEQWKKAGEMKQPAWCYYNNDPSNGAKFGKLYNFYAVKDSRGLAPIGYHVPEYIELIELARFLDDLYKGERFEPSFYIAKKLKSLSGWKSPGGNSDANGNNKSGFNALPGGLRQTQGNFINQGANAIWYGSNCQYFLSNLKDELDLTQLGRDEWNYNFTQGFSVRCVKDVVIHTENSLSKYDLNYFPYLRFGSQIWMIENLKVNKFRNGDTIIEAKTKEEWLNADKNKQPAWCYYDNDTSNGTRYGKLYNWYAVSDKRGLAPEGWHVPSEGEWEKLLNFVRGPLGERSRQLPDKSGFSALLGGSRLINSVFSSNGKWEKISDFNGVGESVDWWSSTQTKSGGAVCVNWSDAHSFGDISSYGCYLGDGFYLRCIRD